MMREIKLFWTAIFVVSICGFAHAGRVGHWDFNENGGTAVYDTSGLGNHGTFPAGTNSWVAGKYGSGLQFNGNPDGGVLVPDHPSLDLTNSFTIEAWVKPASVAAAGAVVSKYTHPGPMIFNLRTANDHSGVWEFEATQANLRSVRPVQLNAWQHLAVTYDGAKMKLYLNGNLESVVDAAGSLNVDDNPVMIGARGRDSADCREPFNGVIDEVRIYDHAVSHPEIIADMAGSLPVGDLPVADAGEDVFTPANSVIVLDGSASADPDGAIVKYVWSRLPDHVVLCSRTVPICEIKTIGREEELIELTVVDDDSNIGKDTVSIFHKVSLSCGNGNVEPDETCDGNSESCVTAQGYPGLKSCNETCSGFGDCVSGLFCGDGIKNGPEVCDGNTQSCTTAAGYTGTQSCNGQCTGFGTCTSSLSCGDGVCTAPLETASNCSQDCSASFSVTLEAEGMATKTTGGSTSGGWIIWSNGYVEDTVQFPAAGNYQFDIVASGSAADNAWPNMELRIDQSVRASFTVNTTSWATYTAEVNVTQGSHKVAIAFTNDYYAPPADRNLYADKVTITGAGTEPPPPPTETIVETFSNPITPANLMAFGPNGRFTFSLGRNGTFVIDGISDLAWQRSDSYLDSSIIRSTEPLPPTYKISVVVGDIDYGLEKLDGLVNDPNFTEGPLNENGFYMLSITDERPDVPHTNIWWHQHRKVVIDVDNNIWGWGMPNPVFMVYFNRDNTLVAYDGERDIWQDQWLNAIHYQENTFYRAEIEKTPQEFILRIFTESGQLLKEARVNLTEIWNEDGLHQEYFVVGDPHENYYRGSMKIKEIKLEY